jgi:uncharacterized protein (DUF779 family)
MFYQAGGCCEGTQHNALKRRFYQRLGDICIGSIENTEFWETRIYSNIGNIRTLL